MIDVFTREMSVTPTRTKTTGEINTAFRKAAGELVGDESTNYVVTTDQGPVFAKLEDAMPEDAVYRQKSPEDKNAMAVIDRNIQGLKVDLAGRIAKKGGYWSAEIGKVVNAHNLKFRDAVHGPPAQIERKNGGDNAQMFRVMQDNAAKFVHNRALTQRRMGEIKEAGAFRAPTAAPSHFNPNTATLRRVASIASM